MLFLVGPFLFLLVTMMLVFVVLVLVLFMLLIFAIFLLFLLLLLFLRWPQKIRVPPELVARGKSRLPSFLQRQEIRQVRATIATYPRNHRRNQD